MEEELEKIIINPIQDGLNAYDFRNAINSAISDESNEYSVVSQTNKALDYFNEMNETAESWAVGGTGTRTGEDTNNAKYYNEQASNHDNAARQSAISAQSSSEDAERSAVRAENSESAAATSEINASTYASNASSSANAAATSETNASTYASNAQQSASNSAASATASQQSANASESSATRADQSANSASQSASSASQSEQNASQSASSASQSEQNASQSASSAASSLSSVVTYTQEVRTLTAEVEENTQKVQNLKQDVADIIDEGFQPGQFPSMEQFINQDIDDRFDLKMPEIEQKIEDEIKEKSGQMLYRNPNTGKFYKDASYTQEFTTPTPSALYTDINTNNAYTYNGANYIKVGPTKVFVSASQPSALEVSAGDMWYQVLS